MALSNYDLIAFDKNAEFCNGVMNTISRGSAVEIYKNWVYVHDADMWKNGRQFCTDTIAEIQEGEIRISHFRIVAKRGPQDSVFVYAIAYDNNYEICDRIAGIGCYGYGDPTEKIAKELGVKLEDYYDTFVFYENSNNVYGIKLYCYRTQEQLYDRDMPPEIYALSFASEKERANYYAKFIGVLPETYQQFLKWLESQINTTNKEELEWFNKIKIKEPSRYNQGDLFLNETVGASIKPTNVGEANEPFLNKLFDSKSS